MPRAPKVDDTITCTRPRSRISPVRWGGNKCCGRHLRTSLGLRTRYGDQGDSWRNGSETGVLGQPSFPRWCRQGGLEYILETPCLSVAQGRVSGKSYAAFDWPRPADNKHPAVNTPGSIYMPPEDFRNVIRYWSPQWRPTPISVRGLSISIEPVFSLTHLHFVHRGMVVTVLRNAHRPAMSFFGNVGAQCVYMQRRALPVQESEDHSDTQCKGGGRERIMRITRPR